MLVSLKVRLLGIFVFIVSYMLIILRYSVFILVSDIYGYMCNTVFINTA